MDRRFIARAAFAVSVLLAGACSQGPAPDASLLIAEKTLLDDTRALSSDEMEGRGAGTSGGRRAAAYIENRFKDAGLAPVEGSYLQAVGMIGTKKDPAESTLSLRNAKGRLEYQSEETLTYWSGAQREVVDIEEAPLVFVGHGVEAPEYQWDDFKGIDVSGKVLLFLNNDPPVSEGEAELFEGEARTYYGRWTYKFEQAMKHGAAGAFMIHTTPSASYPFSVVQHEGAAEQFALDLSGTGYKVDLLGWIDEPTSIAIAGSMGITLQGLFEMGATREFEPVDTGFRISAHVESSVRKLETYNVVGLLQGNDSTLAEQVIVITAHYDHLGTNELLEGDDKIFNGAWDNAAGTSGIISLAQALAANPPRRSVLFLACAAEESGLLGSRWFVADPPFALRRFVANINTDMPQIFGVTSDISAIGVDMNSLGEALREVAARYPVPSTEREVMGVEVKGDTNPNEGSFYRSDQVNFAKVGIPALFVQPGNDHISTLDFDPSEYKDAHYHQVSDEVNRSWDLSGLQRDMRIVFETVLKVANAEEMPRWNPGNEFEEEWKQLHGK